MVSGRVGSSRILKDACRTGRVARLGKGTNCGTLGYIWRVVVKSWIRRSGRHTRIYSGEAFGM